MRNFLLLSALTLVSAAPACCGVSDMLVTFGGQKNLIVWDEETKTEHFVRIANFESEGKAMGFLAPTPETPSLEEADPEVFDYMDSLVPVTLEDAKSGEASAGAKSAESEVEITQQVNVAGYVATTFKATDSKALGEYLKKYGFKMTAPQNEWVKKYVDQKWMITAFQVDLSEGYGATKPVRMTFKSDRPFNPYYVPSDNVSENPAGLQVYFVSDGVYGGSLEGGQNWDHSKMFSVALREEDKAKIAGYLKLKPSDIGHTLEVAQDYAFPTKGMKDLFFQKIESNPVAMPEGFVRKRDKADAREMASTNQLIAGVAGFLLVAAGMVFLLKRRA